VSLVFDEIQLRGITAEELASLPPALARLGAGPQRGTMRYERRRALVLAIVLACCLGLAAWTGLLAVTLPHYYRAGGWRGAWVGFDIVLLAVFAATGWAAWRRRQVLIICLVVLTTLLCCDAWFDVVLDAHTSGFELSLLSALLVELPLALLAATSARRLLRLTMWTIMRRRGLPWPPPPLWQIPLLGVGSDGRLRDLLPQRGDGAPAGSERPDPLRGLAGILLGRAGTARGRPGSGRDGSGRPDGRRTTSGVS
jgi:hypothetical protein